MFNQYRIPRENLLNRTADVTEDGVYESSFSEPSRILGAALENLSAGKLIHSVFIVKKYLQNKAAIYIKLK